MTQEDLEVAQYVGGINTSEYQHMAEAVAKSSQQYEKVQAIKHSGWATNAIGFIFALSQKIYR